ncbi:MAG: hypothetical protein GQ582_06585 [Methyloprofundus sp.]|nr:hypothetical protein [Methyloprofundus sp.]
MATQQTTPPLTDDLLDELVDGLLDELIADKHFKVNESAAANQRKAIRYFFHKTKASLSTKPFFTAGEKFEVQIINMSSSGVRILSTNKLSQKTKISLSISIKGIGTWKVPAKITRSYGNMQYGIAFNTPEHAIIDQLIEHEPDFSIV